MHDVNSLDDSELFGDLEESSSSLSERYFGLSTTTFFIALVVVVLFGIYINTLLFGDNSISVLYELEDYEEYLAQEVVALKAENASLQKEYFELLELNSQ